MGGQNVLQEGISLYGHGDYAGALAFFLSLPQDCGADALELSYYLGLCYFKLQRFDDAMVYLEQVVTAADGKPAEGMDAERVQQCRYILAVMYCRSGRRELADFELRSLQASGYRPASVLASFAYMAWERGDVRQCVSYYEQALDADAENPTALNGLGYVLASEGRDLTRALSLCKKALSLAPESAACLDSIGWVYYKMGLYSQARKYLEQASTRDGGNKIILQHLHDAEMVDE